MEIDKVYTTFKEGWLQKRGFKFAFKNIISI